jgi:phosphoribosylanthranilate isomerase
VKTLGIKVCGITAIEDARAALAAGADYLGLIFAESPRRVSVEGAGRIVAAVPEVAWVGVFSGARVEEILETAAAVPLALVQLHGDGDDSAIDPLRSGGLGVWRAIGVPEPADWPAVESRLAELVCRVDALLLDRRAAGREGGGGMPFDWKGLPAGARALLARERFVLSGGLSPENVGTAIERLGPDVVDVNSGVEASPGRKDAQLMRRFVCAARAAWARARAS